MNHQIWLNGFLGAIAAIALIVLGQLILYRRAKERAEDLARKGLAKWRKVTFMDLIVTCDDEAYSLSRLQIYIWTVFIIISYSAFFAATWTLPEIQNNLLMLMGLNVATTAASTAVYSVKSNSKVQTPVILAAPLATEPTVAFTAAPVVVSAGEAQPALGPPAPPAAPVLSAVAQAVPPQPLKEPIFVHDIFFESDNSLDLPRTQMFAWTVIILFAWVIQVFLMFRNAPNAEAMTKLPDVTLGLTVLMGISNGAYLGLKAAK